MTFRRSLPALLVALVPHAADPGVAPWTAPAPQDDEPHPPHVRQPLPSPEEIAKLPADGGPEFNRLVFEASPYLRQHARNPVDWWPWGEAAFEHARETDRPVFLSIGYATCHWCHVMEHESFEDAEVARLMNEAFVCVKVDREERPDLDHVYMAVTQGLTGRGGWPMTVLMTPEAEPFYAGTYFPRTGRGGRLGMMQLVPQLGRAWKEDREQLVLRAGQITDWLRENSGGSPGEDLDASVVAQGVAQLAANHDRENGGFGSSPKFPIPHNLSLLLRWHVRTGDEVSLDVVESTLRAMRAGGIYDQIGGGFHRYATDERWFLPHFEKMLYDQALHVIAYTGAWQVTGDALYRATAEQVVDYVRRDLGDPGGGFHSAEDADSEGEEGVFYTWPLDELGAVLGEENAALVADVYEVTAEGNYVDEGSGVRMGRSVLMPVTDLARVGVKHGLGPDELQARLALCHDLMFTHRARRIRPFLDDKVLTDWNGLMIAALARSGFAFDDAEHLAAARGAAEFVLAHLRSTDGRLLKRWRAGVAGMPATLEDHAFLAFGLLELYQADGDLRWLREARAVVDTMLAHFHDPEAGGFYLTADDGARLLVRAKEVYDGAIPSGNSVAALALVQLARLVGEPRYEELAAATFRAFAGQVRGGPGAHAQLLQAVEVVAGGGVEIVIAGDRDDPRTRALVDVARSRYLASAVLVHHDPAQREALAQVVPYAAEMGPIDGCPAAYVCRDFVCQEPVTDPEAFARSLDAALRVKD